MKVVEKEIVEKMQKGVEEVEKRGEWVGKVGRDGIEKMGWVGIEEEWEWVDVRWDGVGKKGGEENVDGDHPHHQLELSQQHQAQQHLLPCSSGSLCGKASCALENGHGGVVMKMVARGVGKSLT